MQPILHEHQLCYPSAAAQATLRLGAWGTPVRVHVMDWSGYRPAFFEAFYQLTVGLLNSCRDFCSFSILWQICCRRRSSDNNFVTLTWLSDILGKCPKAAVDVRERLILCNLSALTYPYTASLSASKHCLVSCRRSLKAQGGVGQFSECPFWGSWQICRLKGLFCDVFFVGKIRQGTTCFPLFGICVTCPAAA